MKSNLSRFWLALKIRLNIDPRTSRSATDIDKRPGSSCLSFGDSSETTEDQQFSTQNKQQNWKNETAKIQYSQSMYAHMYNVYIHMHAYMIYSITYNWKDPIADVK